MTHIHIIALLILIHSLALIYDYLIKISGNFVNIFSNLLNYLRIHEALNLWSHVGGIEEREKREGNDLV